MTLRTTVLDAFALLLLAEAPINLARAEVSEVRLAQQFSMGYMQFAIMERSWKDLFFPEIYGLQGS